MTDSNKQSRVLVNVLGIPLLLSAIYFGGIFFQCLIFIAIFMSTFELYSMCLKKDIEIQIIPLFLFFIYLFFTHFLESISMNMGILFFLVILILSLEVFRKKNKPIENIAITIFALIWIGLFMNCIVLIRNMLIQGTLQQEFLPLGMYLTLIMFISVWTCDSTAFLFGSKFGKSKILPNISPNKTWVGTIAGIVSVFILLSFSYYLLNHPLDYNKYHFLHIIILSFVFGGVGQIGDFIESMIKRQFEVKDSGTSLRGHGGFLDRMDSLILVAPSFYLYLKYVGIIG